MISLRNKTYKVDYSRPVFPQFLQVIKVESKSETAIWWKAQLQRQVDKHLNLNKTITEQEIEMLRMEKELEILYPDTFPKDDEAKKLYFAMRTVARLHRSRRNHIIARKKTKASTKEDKARDIKSIVNLNVIDLTLDDSDCELNHKPMPLSSPKRNVSISPCFETSRLTIQGTGIAFVFDFLSKCKPSMSFLLHVFLEHGCDSENQIRAVAKLSSTKREEWLAELFDQNAPSVGRRLNKEDIRRLNNLFAAYNY